MEEKLSTLLIDHSLKLQKEDILVIDYQEHTRNLLESLLRDTQNRGIKTLLFFRQESTRLSDLERLDSLLDGASSYIRLGGGNYKKPPECEAKDLQRKEGDIMIKRCLMKWVSTQYPSEYMSRKLGIPFKRLRGLYFRCCFIDYQKQRRIQEAIANNVEEGEVQILSQDTNIKFEIIGHPHFCDGRINIPDGELFYGIDPLKTNEEIYFSIPTIFGALKFNNVWLEFRKGKVINYSSDNPRGLKKLLSLDDYSPYLGEFGIGTNPYAQIVGNSFYDEKVAGTFHLALGAMNRKMNSRLHIDLVKQARNCEIKNNGRPLILTKNYG